jgi:hypothetical protein
VSTGALDGFDHCRAVTPLAGDSCSPGEVSVHDYSWFLCHVYSLKAYCGSSAVLDHKRPASPHFDVVAADRTASVIAAGVTAKVSFWVRLRVSSRYRRFGRLDVNA